MEQTIWVARHGNRLDFVNPHWALTAERYYDSPLAEDGIRQAQHLGLFLQRKGITHIFASPFRRTVETAQYIAEALDLTIKVESGLSEFLSPLSMPSTATRFSLHELASDFPRIDLRYTSRGSVRYPEITKQQVRKRVTETVQSVVADFPEAMLLVSHEGAVAGLIQGLTGNARRVDASALCCLFKLIRSNSKYSLQEHDYAPSPIEKSPRSSMTYYKNQLLQRLKYVWK